MDTYIHPLPLEPPSLDTLRTTLFLCFPKTPQGLMNQLTINNTIKQINV